MRSAPLVALILLTLAPAAGAAASASLSVSVKESGCANGATYCYSVDSGSLADITAGTAVTVTFHNTGTMDHEILATSADKMDGKHAATTEDGKLASVEDVSPGGSGTMNFTAPSDASGVYFWCGKEGHEVHGMYMLASYEPVKKANSPGFELAALVAALGALAIAMRRGR